MLLLTKRCLLQSSGIKSGQLGTDGKLLLSMPYHQCDQIRQNNVDFKSIWPFFEGLSSHQQNFEPSLAIFYAIGKIFIAENGQILSKIFFCIGSHCPTMHVYLATPQFLGLVFLSLRCPCIFFKWAIPGLFFLYFRPFNNS